MPHAFISYVRENVAQHKRLEADLYAQGIDIWTDRNIGTGRRWRTEIRRAIQDGVSFLACFSSESVTRGRSYMYEEIFIAIDTLRQMPIDRSWFIPLKLNECQIPDIDIGPGQTLRDIQWVDLYPNWEEGISKIVSSIRQSLTYEPESNGSNEPRLPSMRGKPSAETLEAWKSVWGALFTLKVVGERLLAHIDLETMKEYASCLDNASKKVGEAAFYFNKDDYEELNRILYGAIRFGSFKTNIMNLIEYRTLDTYQMELVVQSIKSNLTEFNKFSGYVDKIYDKYSQRPNSASEQISDIKNNRNEAELKNLQEASLRWQREEIIRRNAEIMIRSGKITLENECPKGHGKLKEWEGVPRCWTCGWPWKDIGGQ